MINLSNISTERSHLRRLKVPKGRPLGSFCGNLQTKRRRCGLCDPPRIPTYFFRLFWVSLVLPLVVDSGKQCRNSAERVGKECGNGDLPCLDMRCSWQQSPSLAAFWIHPSTNKANRSQPIGFVDALIAGTNALRENLQLRCQGILGEAFPNHSCHLLNRPGFSQRPQTTTHRVSRGPMIFLRHLRYKPRLRGRRRS
jgi:hypothetical protein